MMVRDALAELFRRSKAEAFDFDAIEVTAQQLLRRIGGRMVERAVVQRPTCHNGVGHGEAIV